MRVLAYIRQRSVLRRSNAHKAVKAARIWTFWHGSRMHVQATPRCQESP